MKKQDKLITPRERLDLVPFNATKTSQDQGLKNIRLEDYGKLPFVELDMPPMDHHVLIFNYNPPKSAIYHGCGGQHHNDRWQKDTCAVIPAFHDNQWLIPETDSSGLHILFPHTEIAKITEETFDLDPALTEFNSTFQTENPQLSQLASLMHAELHSDFAHGPLYLESLAVAASVQFIKQFSNRSNERFHYNGALKKPGIIRIIKYIDDNINQKITLDCLAQVLHMSAYHFSRSFKVATGYTPFEYLMIRRAELAKEKLIKAKELSLAEIASCVGFTDQSHMNKVIKRLYGKTAGQIRSET